MRPELKHLIMKRVREDERDNRNSRDYNDYNDYNDMRQNDYNYEMGQDNRRGVRGSGRRRRDRGNDYNDYDDEYEKVKLSRKLKSIWKNKLINTDGKQGPHFDIDELMDAMQNMRLSFDGYDESDVCLMANVIYSDFGKTLKHVIPPDKESHYYVALAKDFLEDDDSGLEGSEKVAGYYHFIVNG